MEIYNRIPIGTRIAFIRICMQSISEMADIIAKINNIIELINEDSTYLGNFNEGEDLIILFRSYISYLDEIVSFNQQYYFLEILKKAQIPSIKSEMCKQLDVFTTTGTDYKLIKNEVTKTLEQIHKAFINKMPEIRIMLDQDLSSPETIIKLISYLCRSELTEVEQLIDGFRKIIGEKFDSRILL